MTETSFIDIDKVEADDLTEPITLAEAKAQCRVDIDYTDDDDFITALISQARAAIENYCHISLVEKTLTVTTEMKNKPWLLWQNSNRMEQRYNEFELPYGPVASFTSLSYIDCSGSVQNLVSITDYMLRGSLFKTIRINNSYDNNILVYVTGYTIVPYDLKLGILNELVYRYELRGDPSNVRATAFTEEGVCQAARVLVDKYVRLAWQ